MAQELTYELARFFFFIYQGFYEILINFDIAIDIIIMMDIKNCTSKKEGQNFCHLHYSYEYQFYWFLYADR